MLLRGDMDALPVTELTGLPYASRFGGVMHACGHDLHTAMLAGAARLLCGRRAELAGDVIFMFQPGEEGYSGADKMIGEGVLDAAGERWPVAAYALHVSSTQLPVRRVHHQAGADAGRRRHHPGDRAGPRRPCVAAAPGGRPDHGGLRDGDRPADPGDAAVRRVRPGGHHGGELPRGNDRQRDPGRGAVPGDGPVIQPRPRARGSRTTIVRLVNDIADAHGLTAEAEYIEEYPVTVNDETEAAFARTVAAEMFGELRSVPKQFPMTGAEDFSYVLQHVPGAFISVGACPPDRDPETAPSNHSAEAVFDDAVLADGAALYAELAMRRLGVA